MKKIILSVATLSAALAQAQVGINQETPKATLDISVKKANETTDSQEGLLIPRVTKEKALKMANNSTTQPEESALIYVNDTVFTDPQDGTEVKVEDITEKGYYFWNGVKWVKSSGNKGSIWKKLANGNVYLEDSMTKDSVYYHKKGGFTLTPKEKIATTDWYAGLWPPSTPLQGYITRDVDYQNEGYTTSYISNDGYASNIPYKVDLTQNDPDYITGMFQLNSLVVDQNATKHTRGYLTQTNSLSIPAENTNNYDILYAVQNASDHMGKGIVKNVMGVYNSGILGSPDSKAKYVRGTFSQATAYSEHSLEILESSFNYASPRGSGEISAVNGVRNYTSLADTFASEVTDFSMSRNDFRIAKGSRAPQGGSIKSLYGGYTTFSIPDNSSVTISKMFGLRLDDVSYGQTANFGLFIGNVGNDTASENYSIYTHLGKSSLGDVLEIRNDEWKSNQETIFQFANGKSKKYIATSQIIDQMNGAGDGGSNLIFKTQSPTPGTNPNLTLPTEKMVIGADGKVKVNDLAGSGERLVTANQDGVLSTSTTSLADLESLWANDASAQLVKLKATSDGTTPRVSTPGIGRNDITISDDGKITARGFVGYNGATIFPDYVFEKYYTGESTIKADYNFHNLASVESFIKTNGHLPGYKSAKEIASKGLIDLGATQLTNVEKIEELYLHTIEQEKKIETQEQKIANQQKQIEELQSLVQQLLNK